MMKRITKSKWISWLIACLGILLVAGFVFAQWRNVSGSKQAQSAAAPNPDEQFIQGLQQMLGKDNLSAEDRATLQKKLGMMQRLEDQRHAGNDHANSSKKNSPNEPPIKSPQSFLAPSPEEGIFEGSGGLVHSWQAMILNQWQKSINGQMYQVLAGSLPDDPMQGLLIVMVSQGKVLARQEQTYLTPQKTGALHITSASGTTLSLLDESGVAWTFDLNTREFSK